MEKITDREGNSQEKLIVKYLEDLGYSTGEILDACQDECLDLDGRLLRDEALHKIEILRFYSMRGRRDIAEKINANSEKFMLIKSQPQNL